MPKMEMTPNDMEFYRGECVKNEYSAAENWTKKYGPRICAFDGMYKQLPGMQRCIAGLDVNESLQYIEKGNLEAPPRPKGITVKEMSQKSYLPRPKSGAHQNVGLGGVGVHSDYIEPPRAADTIYERDYCVRLDEFNSRIQGRSSPIDTTGKGVTQAGTMAIIPTSWQFPSGTKQPEGFMVRSELRKQRLERDKKKKEEAQANLVSETTNEPCFHNYNPMMTVRREQPSEKASEVYQKKPFRDDMEENRRVLMRGGRPTQSRSWAPIDNTAPKGWYKVDVGPGKLYQKPGMMSMLTTPQARLNVLKRRIDLRQQVLDGTL